MIIIRFFISMCLFFALSSVAKASDPFALLFGDERIDAREDNAPNADDITLLRLTIRDYLIDDSWSAFETGRGLCLPVKALTDALEFPLAYSEAGISGWLLNKDMPFNIALAEDTGFIPTDLGWCAYPQALERLFPVKINYSPSTLTLQIQPSVTLPMDARLARLAARQTLIMNPEATGPSYKYVENDYHWLSWPIIDMNANISASSGQVMQGLSNFEAAGDLFKMTARLRMAARYDQGFESARLSLFRESDLANQLGRLKARSFALGDVSAYSQPLLGLSTSGRGATISNRPLFQPDKFDAASVRGPLPKGWEAELYDGQILLAFVTKADANGDYLFENIALRPGYNRLTVKLFGPHGEEEQRVISQFVGSELIPAKRLHYAAGFIEPEASLFGGMFSQDEAQPDPPVLHGIYGQDIYGQASSSQNPYGFLSLNYGLSSKHSARFDMRSDGNNHLAGLSLISSALGGYGLVRMASDGKGRPAVQARFQRRLFEQSSFSIGAVDYGDLKTNINGDGPASIRKQANLRLDSQIQLGRGLLPFQTETIWVERADKSRALNMSARLSGQLSHMRWSNSLKLYDSTDQSQQMQGELLISRRLGGARLRASMGYSYDQAFKLSHASLAFQKKLGRDSFLQASAAYDMDRRLSAFDASLTHNFDNLALSLKSGANSDGTWSAGLGLSMALFYDKSKGHIATARPGLSRSGTIAPRVFDDLNENGIFDQGDKVLSGVQFITDNSLRSETGNVRGVTQISNLPTAKYINSEIKLASIEDPFLYPQDIGRQMILRPGQVLSYDVPLVAVGEAEGHLTLLKDGIETPIAGVTIQAIDASGNIIVATKSEYDGYFYFGKLPAIDLTLRVKDEAVKSVKGAHTPMPISLSRSAPTILGLALRIEV